MARLLIGAVAAVMLLAVCTANPSDAIELTGLASTYNPYRKGPGYLEFGTSSGERYNPNAWTAAIQIDLRCAFGCVHYGRHYKPSFALVEYHGKRIIVRINDVGPLRPGRIIDLSERSMRYFDSTMRLGVLMGVRVTLLSGDDWVTGPLAVPRSMISAYVLPEAAGHG
jgi:rare lipoprotein A